MCFAQTVSFVPHPALPCFRIFWFKSVTQQRDENKKARFGNYAPESLHFYRRACIFNGSTDEVRRSNEYRHRR
jgi:hypothetical protein